MRRIILQIVWCAGIRPGRDGRDFADAREKSVSSFAGAGPRAVSSGLARSLASGVCLPARFQEWRAGHGFNASLQPLNCEPREFRMAGRALERRMGAAYRGTGVALTQGRRDGRDVPGAGVGQNAGDRIFHAGAEARRDYVLLPALHSQPGALGKIGCDGFESHQHRRQEKCL